MQIRAVKIVIAAIASAMVTNAAAMAQTAPTPAEMEAYDGLHAAVVAGSSSRLDQLVRTGADVNTRDSFGRTPLMIAAYRGDIAVARALIELGANVNALDHHSYDAVTIAAARDDVEMLRLLLSSGGNARAIVGPVGGSALIAAARRGNAAAVAALIDARAPVDHVDYLGNTALLEAVEHGKDDARYLGVIKALIDAGADLQRTNRQGRTAVALAQAQGLSAIVRVLAPRSNQSQ
jgi:uncharacterized protein